LTVYHGDFEFINPQCTTTSFIACQNLTFNDILTWMNDFLDANQQAIIEVKYEAMKKSLTRRDGEWMAGFNNLFVDDNGTPGIQVDSG
jgi:hypothetical protein